VRYFYKCIVSYDSENTPRSFLDPERTIIDILMLKLDPGPEKETLYYAPRTALKYCPKTLERLSETENGSNPDPYIRAERNIVNFNQ
jgi:hypothetical protein